MFISTNLPLEPHGCAPMVMGIPCSSCKIDLRQAEDDTSINGYN